MIIPSRLQEEEEVPTKVVTKEVDLEVCCRIHTFDYECRTDGRSMRTIITHVAPRRLLLVHAPEEVIRATNSGSTRILYQLLCKTVCHWTHPSPPFLADVVEVNRPDAQGLPVGAAVVENVLQSPMQGRDHRCLSLIPHLRGRQGASLRSQLLPSSADPVILQHPVDRDAILLLICRRRVRGKAHLRRGGKRFKGGGNGGDHRP